MPSPLGLVDEDPNLPTYLWMPEFRTSMGVEAIEFAVDAGLVLDPWQDLALMCALALDDQGLLLLFELLIILSRQNGKGTFLEALEMAWLFLFNYKLIMHSAHLFETSREHFLRILYLIESNPDWDRRIRKVAQGRGSEEIFLRDGARLKFVTRSGKTGRGFTGTKNVYDEAMFLDSVSLSASLPALATQKDAQVIYTASAGMKESTQLAAVRARGLAPTRVDDFTGQPFPGDPALGVLEWAIEKPVLNEAGRLISGWDPTDQRTVARVNPAMVRTSGVNTISWQYVQKEARTFGGFYSEAWLRERCGVGTYPEDDEQWLVISKQVWLDGADEASTVDKDRKVLAVAGDPERGTSALCLAARRPDGVAHLEVVERHRGTAWLAARIPEVLEGLDRVNVADDGEPVIVLKGDVTEHVGGLLQDAGVTVHLATAGEYATGCQSLTEQVRVREAVHLGTQKSLNKAVATAQKRTGSEGGWRWDLDTAQDASPLRGVTLALLGLDRFVPKEDMVGDVW